MIRVVLAARNKKCQFSQMGPLMTQCHDIVSDDVNIMYKSDNVLFYLKLHSDPPMHLASLDGGIEKNGGNLFQNFS